MHLFLDIETIPGQNPDLRAKIAAEITHPASMTKAETIAKWEAEKKPAEIERALARTSFDGALGMVAVIGWAFDDEPENVIANSDYANLQGEADLLRKFFAVIDERVRSSDGVRAPHIIVVGHNVADFDLRFLFRRAVIHGIKPPPSIKWVAKPWDPMIYDTMLAWCGSRDTVSLDKLCSVLGIANKGEELGGEDIDGSKVWEYVRSGEIKKVAVYCAGDVARAREIYKRLNFIDLVAPPVKEIAKPAAPVVPITKYALSPEAGAAIERLKGVGFRASDVIVEIETAANEAVADAIMNAAIEHGITPGSDDYVEAVAAFNARFSTEYPTVLKTGQAGG